MMNSKLDKKVLEIILRLRSSLFIKNLSKLIFGSTAAQLITIAFTIFIVRLYTPAAFGEYAVVFSMAQILPIFLTFRYELSIMNAITDRDAFITAVSIIFLVFALSIVLGSLLLVAVHHFQLPNFIVLNIKAILSISVLSALITVLAKYLNRLKHYSIISFRLFSQSVVVNVLQFAIGFLLVSPDSSGLIYGYLGGLIFSFCIFSYVVVKENKTDFATINILDLKGALFNNRKIAIYNLPNGLLSKATAELPVFLLSMSFGSQIVGYFVLTRRVLSQPIYIVSKNIGLIFHQTAGTHFNKKLIGLSRLTNQTTLLLLCIIAPFSIMILFFSRDLFYIMFGEGWVTSAEYAILLLPLIIGRFIVSPIANIYLLSDRSDTFLYINIARLMLATFGFYLGYIMGSAESSIMLYSIFTFIFYVFTLIHLFRLSNYYERQFNTS